jgi:hypothetical protein
MPLLIVEQIYMDDVRAVNAKDPRFAAALLAHAVEEGFQHVVQSQHGIYPGDQHEIAKGTETRVLSELTGHDEQTRVDSKIGPKGAEAWVRFEYTSVAYDVYHKSFGPALGIRNPDDARPIIVVQNKKCGCNR